MKKIYLSALALVFGAGINAQLVNGGLETWTGGNPNGWDTYNALIGQVGGVGGSATINGVDITASTTEGTGDAAEGNSYAKLEAWSLAGVSAYGIPDGIYPGLMDQKIKTSTQFESVRFSYRATVVGGDKPVFFVTVKGTGPNADFGQNATGQGMLEITADQSDWKEVTVPITWIDGTDIDSIEVLFASTKSGVFAGETEPTADGTLFEIDNIEFITAGGGSVGLEELAMNAVNVFPNPAVNTVTFDVKGLDNGTITINSITGQEVVNTTIANGSKAVNVSHLNNGVYIYAVRNMNGEIIKTNKLVIRK